MCGIAGQVGRDPRTIQRRYAAYCAMQQTLARRGPDQRGMYICGAAALIHARLAVVDLENGLQPMQLDWQGTPILLYGYIDRIDASQSSFVIFDYKSSDKDGIIIVT